MRSVVVVALFLVALAACGSGAAEPGTQAQSVSLTVRYWEKGVGTGEPRRLTLRCNPARGTVARPGVACRRLAARGSARLFAPVPEGAACTQLYGGPQVARVVGRVRGMRVDATLTRTDGCHISRWDALAPWLLPAGGVG